METKIIKTVLLGFAMAISGAANAVVITFDEYDRFQLVSNTTFTNSGYEFTTSASTSIFDNTCCRPEFPNNGDLYLAVNYYSHGGFTLTNADSSAFDLLSFDIAETFMGLESSHWADYVRVEATYADASTFSQDFALDGIQDGSGPANDFQTYLTGNEFTNLQSVHFMGIGDSTSFQGFTIDNIDIETTSVPEPTAIALLSLGLIGLGFSRKKA